MQQGKPKILIVDDTVGNIQILLEGLRDDYSVVPARSGERALALVATSPPDLILLDVMMPGLDGFQVCRLLKENPATADIPVIFITALHDEESEVQALTVGGVDFISKPILPVVVRARVKTHLALRKAYRDLADSHEQLRWERKLVEDILLSMREQPLLRESFVRTLLTPVERTNGDIFLLDRRPDGYIHALVGDCTGHGLPAAIVGPMVMDCFHAMTRKGLPPEEILSEINRKLLHRAPSHIFMAGCFLELSPRLDALRLWNGGMPELLLRRADTWSLWPAGQPPLGVVTRLEMGDFPQAIPLRPGDRLYLYSDGVVESRSPQGKMFGTARLQTFLAALIDRNGELEELLPELTAFRGGEVSEDDITVVEFLTPDGPGMPAKDPS